MAQPRQSWRSRSSAAARVGLLATGACALLASWPTFEPAATFGAETASAPETVQLQLQLEAGEFSPVLDAAARVDDPVKRDALYSQIARGQAKAGARDAALQTAGHIDSDTARSAVLHELTRTAGKSSWGGALGGAQQPDFDALIEMITDTVNPGGWDTVGGLGAIAPFPAGVYIDVAGVLQRRTKSERPQSDLDMVRQAARRSAAPGEIHRASHLRKVSLTRLERAVQALAAAGRRPTEEMRLLAGLERVKFLFVFPETGDVVLAGPADHWRVGAEGRTIAENSGRPVVQLDDLVVVLRQLFGAADATFGCSITPTEENLKRTRDFLEASRRQPLAPDRREAWLEQLRGRLGRQVIEVDGIDPGTRVGQVLVEADYRMKLVGLGLEKGTVGVASYLDTVKIRAGQAPPPIDVLRWWFTMNYDAVRTSADHNAFEIRGTGVQVLSENELLTALGRREHTGASAPLNQEFAQSFTDHFTALAERYPVYAELQNVFDLALVAAILKAEHVPDRLGWHLTCYGEPRQYAIPLGPAPRLVESVINHRLVGDQHIVAGVSGGVHADPWKYVAPGAVKTDATGKLKRELGSARPGNRPRDVWWWD